MEYPKISAHLARIVLLAALLPWPETAMACCAVSRPGKPLVNADQAVIIVWNEKTQTEHFIRKPTFKGGGEKDFGFLVPTPSKPQLEEGGDAAFGLLASITAPPPSQSAPGCVGCSNSSGAAPVRYVRVIQEKAVAGMDTVVLQANDETALVDWLQAHDYSYSPEVAAWAKPYLSGDWCITAMKISKVAGRNGEDSVAGSLRISFKTDRPLFPYRESDSRKEAAALSVKGRLLRIYFLADSRYEGKLGDGSAWSGKTAWSRALRDGDRSEIVRRLEVPSTSVAVSLWLTEFEDHWKYGLAAGDLYFSKSSDQAPVQRVAQTGTVDPTFATVAMFGVVLPVLRRRRRVREGG